MDDLSERYRSPRQYLTDAFHSLPLIIASQVRRTLNIGRIGVVAITLFLLLNATPGSISTCTSARIKSCAGGLLNSMRPRRSHESA